MKIAVSHIICFWEMHVWVYLAFQILSSFKEIYYDVDCEWSHLYHQRSRQFYHKFVLKQNWGSSLAISYCNFVSNILEYLMIKKTTFDFMFLVSLAIMTLNIISVFERHLQNKILQWYMVRLSAILSLNPFETGTFAASSAVFNNPSFLRTTKSYKKMLPIFYNHDFFFIFLFF